MCKANDFGIIKSKLRMESGLRVRKRDFPCVYYNNGNSLPVSSIPISRDHFEPVLRAAKCSCVSSFLSNSANRGLEGIFFGRACILLAQAGLFFSKAGRQQIQRALAIQVENVNFAPTRKTGMCEAGTQQLAHFGGYEYVGESLSS